MHNLSGIYHWLPQTSIFYALVDAISYLPGICLWYEFHFISFISRAKHRCYTLGRSVLDLKVIDADTDADADTESSQMEV